jgi:hypothetical protein
MKFIIKNKSQFTVNSEIYNINTRQHTNHQPTSNLTGYEQGIYYSGVRVYNNLPSHTSNSCQMTLRILNYNWKSFCTSTPSIHWRSISNIKWTPKLVSINIRRKKQELNTLPSISVFHDHHFHSILYTIKCFVLDYFHTSFYSFH